MKEDTFYIKYTFYIVGQLLVGMSILGGGLGIDLLSQISIFLLAMFHLIAPLVVEKYV